MSQFKGWGMGEIVTTLPAAALASTVTMWSLCVKNQNIIRLHLEDHQISTYNCHLKAIRTCLFIGNHLKRNSCFCVWKSPRFGSHALLTSPWPSTLQDIVSWAAGGFCLLGIQHRIDCANPLSRDHILASSSMFVEQQKQALSKYLPGHSNVIGSLCWWILIEIICWQLVRNTCFDHWLRCGLMFVWYWSQ